MKNKLQTILAEFGIDGKIDSFKAMTEGHINSAFMVSIINSGRQTEKFTVQKVNINIFRDPKLLMDNIVAVTAHIGRKLAESGSDPSRGTLNFRKAKSGEYFQMIDGECWRIYDFIDDVHTISKASTTDEFALAAKGFANFQMMLADFDGSTLGETIPDFHNTPKRIDALKAAIMADKAGRASRVKKEIEFALSLEEFAGSAMTMLKNGELPLRVTHNDTKINNLLFDNKTNDPICVIDLDTVMPGLAMNDFGDAIRTGAAKTAEDSTDLRGTELDIDLYNSYLDAYLAVCGQSLTDREIETLPLGAKLMTFECGVRFLTDHLDGDNYFRIDYPDHNLDRAKNQFKLLESMEKTI